ncbi:MAG: hypothetical protein HC848_10900 [Limnobacter sp.]|nr:hypothetical protein [Limnobacter sp.]
MTLPVVVAAVLGLLAGGSESAGGLVPWPSVMGWRGVAVLVVFSGLLLAANYALQYGAARLPANVTAVLMLSEVLFATLSAVWLTEERLTLKIALGGALIFLRLAPVH